VAACQPAGTLTVLHDRQQRVGHVPVHFLDLVQHDHSVLAAALHQELDKPGALLALVEGRRRAPQVDGVLQLAAVLKVVAGLPENVLHAAADEGLAVAWRAWHVYERAGVWGQVMPAMPG
jgi:hypothetical protein